jgi:hypothetical protein
MLFMWWWIVPMILLFALRGGRRRWVDQRAGWSERYLSELQRTVESQREHIDQLEGRLSRVEEGLDFAERLLAQRTGATTSPA